MSAFAGYHIFQGIFDVKFGIGVRHYSGWNDMVLTSPTGAKIATVKVASFRSTVPTLDLGG